MLSVPEYLSFTTAEAGVGLIAVSVDFDDPIARMPERYVERDLLNQMALAVSQGTLPFMSFDEHPMRVVTISYSEIDRRAVIKTCALTTDDGFPKDWKAISIGCGNFPTESLILPRSASKQASIPRLRVGTMSSELQGAAMRLEKNAAGVNAIMEALEAYRPDVLLTAGHSLNDETDLATLDARLGASDWDGLLFFEVKDYEGDLPRRIGPAPDISSHCLFTWTRNGGMQRMGRQYFVTSIEARKHLPTLVHAFEENLQHRVVEFRGRRFGGLICGEINALQGRNSVTALTPRIESWLRSLNVVVNPTHDLMGNGGTLKAKRTWASQGGRAYVSSSNWNSMKQVGEQKLRRQTRTARTLHTVYIDGHEIAQSLCLHHHENFEYREAHI